VAHHVVAEDAGKAPAEARQTGQRGRLEARAVLLDERERIALERLGHAPAVDHLHGAIARDDAHVGRQADEGIAAESLAADDGLEQERVRRVGELEVERQRRVEVGEDFLDEGDAVVPLRRERAEFRFGDHVDFRSSWFWRRLGWRATRDARGVRRGAASATHPRATTPRPR
jgi:hypothetical protein